MCNVGAGQKGKIGKKRRTDRVQSDGPKRPSSAHLRLSTNESPLARSPARSVSQKSPSSSSSNLQPDQFGSWAVAARRDPQTKEVRPFSQGRERRRRRDENREGKRIAEARPIKAEKEEGRRWTGRRSRKKKSEGGDEERRGKRRRKRNCRVRGRSPSPSRLLARPAQKRLRNQVR